MRKMTSLFFLSIAVNLFSAARAPPAQNEWVKAGYTASPVSNIADRLYGLPNGAGYTHGLDLDVIMLKGSGWEKNTIFARLTRLADIFKQCEIKFENVYFVGIDPPDGRLDFFPWYCPDKHDRDKYAGSTYQLARPYPNSGTRLSITYLRSFTNGETASSGPVWYWGPDCPMRYKSFISAVTTTENYISKRPKGYSVEAHELGHTMFESPHLGKDNIMALTPRKRLPVIKEEHCKLARAHELVKKLH